MKKFYTVSLYLSLSLSPLGAMLSNSFEGEEQKSEHNTTICSETFSTCMDEAYKGVKNINNDEPCLIVLGNTGAGKSTIIAALQGCTMTEKCSKRNNKKYLSCMAPKNHKTPTISAPGQFSAQTRYPAIFKPVNSFFPFSLCDTPGYKDTNITEEAIARAISVQVALKKLNIKGLLVIFTESELDGSRGDAFKSMLSTLHMLLKDPFYSLDRIYFLFNKFDRSFQEMHIRNMLEDLSISKSIVDKQVKSLAHQISHKGNIALVNPLNIQPCVTKLKHFLKNRKKMSDSFCFALDKEKMSALKIWLRETIEGCVDAYKEILRFKKSITIDERSIEEVLGNKNKMKASDKQVYKITFGGIKNTKKFSFEYQKILLKTQQINYQKIRNKVFQCKHKLENDTTQIPYEIVKTIKKTTKETKEIPITRRENVGSEYNSCNGMTKLGTHLFGIATLGIGYAIMADDGFYKDQYEDKTYYGTVENTVNEIKEEKIDIPYKYDTASKDLVLVGKYPSKEVCTQIPKNEHPKAKDKIKDFLVQYNHIGHELSIIEKNEKLLQQLEKLSALSPRIKTVYKLNKLTDSITYDRYGLGIKAKEFLEILHKNKFAFQHEYCTWFDKFWREYKLNAL